MQSILSALSRETKLSPCIFLTTRAWTWKEDCMMKFLLIYTCFTWHSPNCICICNWRPGNETQPSTNYLQNCCTFNFHPSIFYTCLSCAECQRGWSLTQFTMARGGLPFGQLVTSLSQGFTYRDSPNLTFLRFCHCQTITSVKGWGVLQQTAWLYSGGFVQVWGWASSYNIYQN